MPSTLIRGGLIMGQGEGDILISGERIVATGTMLEAPAGASIVNARGLLVCAGLVNTHHHIAQSLLKGIPGSLNLGLNDWLGAVPYRYWPHFTPECLYTAARIGFSELLRAGCTTCADHHYLYHRHTTPELQEAVLQAAREIGIRLVLCRGIATTIGTHRGMSATKLEPESLDLCISRIQDLATRHHDASESAMTRVAVAPTSLVHTCPESHLKPLAEFARSEGLRLHSHLLEVGYDDIVCRQQYGISAVAYADQHEWLGPDVWFAHLVHADAEAVRRLGETRTGIAHCPSSNSRLGSGVAPVPALVKAGVRISIGVDGSGAAESGSFINELMLTWLLHRTRSDASATNASTVMQWATAGGAEVLGFTDAGVLAPGKLADLVLYDLNDPRFLGLWQPELAPVICGEPLRAKHVMVNGRWRMFAGLVEGLDFRELQHDTRRMLRFLQQVAA